METLQKMHEVYYEHEALLVEPLQYAYIPNIEA